VWQSKGHEGDPPDWETFYVTMLDSHIMMICNNHDFLRETLARKSGYNGPRALPVSLVEWALVDRTAQVWGIAHLKSRPIALFAPDSPQVAGVAVCFGSKRIIARAIAKTDPWRQFVGAEPQVTLTTRKFADGVWEVNIPAQEPDASFAALLLMSALGFTVLI
jgi:hypothetical protein